MITTFGTSDTSTKVHIDTSKTLLGAKRYATKHGCKNVTKRVGYHSSVVAIRTENNKWLTV